MARHNTSGGLGSHSWNGRPLPTGPVEDRLTDEAADPSEEVVGDPLSETPFRGLSSVPPTSASDGDDLDINPS